MLKIRNKLCILEKNQTKNGIRAGNLEFSCFFLSFWGWGVFLGVGSVFAPQGPRQRRPPPCAATRRMRQAPIVKRLSTRPVPHGDPGLGQRRSIAEAESKRGRGRCFGGCFLGEPGLGAGRTGPHGAVREPGLGGPPPRGRPWRPAPLARLDADHIATEARMAPRWPPDSC